MKFMENKSGEADNLLNGNQSKIGRQNDLSYFAVCKNIYNGEKSTKNIKYRHINNAGTVSYILSRLRGGLYAHTGRAAIVNVKRICKIAEDVGSPHTEKHMPHTTYDSKRQNPMATDNNNCDLNRREYTMYRNRNNMNSMKHFSLKYISIFILTALSISLFSVSAFAEGSADMVRSAINDNTGDVNAGQRSFISVKSGTWVDLSRDQEIRAYAREGEKLYIAASVYSNKADIEMTLPDGSTKTFDSNEYSRLRPR